MKFLGLVLVLVAVGCVDYAKAPSAKAASQEPTQVEPADECVTNVDCPADEICDQGECVVSKPEPMSEPDIFEGEPDTEAPSSDTASGGVDTSVPPSPDTVPPSPDTTPTPGPDTLVSGPDTAPNPDSSPSVGEDGGEGDTVQPGPDTTAPEPDAEVPQPDTETPGTDTIQPGLDTVQPQPDTGTPSPDVKSPEPDVHAPSPDAGLPPIPEPDASADAETGEPDATAPAPDAASSTDSSPQVGEDTGEGDAESDAGEPACVPADEVCGNAVDEDCDGEDVPCPPPEVDVAAIAVEDSESESLSLQTDVTFNGPLGWETYEDTASPFSWELEIGSSDSVSELYRLNFFRKPAGDWVCQVPFGGVPTCLVLPALVVNGESIVVEDFTDRVIIPANVAALMCDPRYEACAVTNIGYCRGEQACEIACDNGLDDDNDGLVDLDDPHCN